MNQPKFNQKPETKKSSSSKLNQLKSKVLGGILAVSSLTQGVVTAEKSIAQPMDEGVKIARSVESESNINMTNIPLELVTKNPKAFHINHFSDFGVKDAVIGLNKSRVIIQKPGSNGLEGYFNGYNLKEYQTHNTEAVGNIMWDQSKREDKNRTQDNGWGMFQSISNVDKNTFNQKSASVTETFADRVYDFNFVTPTQHSLDDGIYGNDFGTESNKLIIKKGMKVNSKIKDIVNTVILVENVSQLRQFRKIDHSQIKIMSPEIKTKLDLMKLVGMFPNTTNTFVINAEKMTETDFQTINNATRELYDNALKSQLDRISGSGPQSSKHEKPEFEPGDTKTRLQIEQFTGKFFDSNNPEPGEFQLFMEEPGKYKFSAHNFTKEMANLKPKMEKLHLRYMPVGFDDRNNDGIKETVKEGDVMMIPVLGKENERVTIEIQDSSGTVKKVIKRGPAQNVVYNLFRASGSSAEKFKLMIRMSDENRKITSKKTFDITFE
jgi:hypothetical protein